MASATRYALMTALMLAGCAALRGERAEAGAPPAEPESKIEKTAEKAGEIATQPARDLGVADTKIPPALTHAAADPYSLAGVQSCARITAAIRELNEALGPDYRLAGEQKEDRTEKVAEAGAKTIVNSLIPFRSLVRVLTGAAEAKRHLDDAIDAGYARRGFLRGVASSRGCRVAS